MLRELSVQNLALIEDIHVELDSGYCAWTGETGAGKSLLLNALGLVLGRKASADMVRSGKTEARASAVFEVGESRLKADVEAILGGSLDEELLILTRRVTASGRSSAQVNGLPVTLATLQSLGQRLIDIHGQHEGRALADPDHQRRLLDDFGNLGERVREYRQSREEHERLRLKRRQLLLDAESRVRERALLEFEREEIAQLDPKEGEVAELGREAQRLGNIETIREAASEGYSLLYEADASVQGLLERVSKQLAPLASSIPEFELAKGVLDRIAEDSREVAYTLRSLARTARVDPRRLDLIEARLALYRKLSARFRCDANGLPARRAEVESRLKRIVDDDSSLQELDAPIAQAWSKLKHAATALSTARRATCLDFAKAVRGRLSPLGLPHASLDIRLVSSDLGDDPNVASPADDGIDRVEWLFSANPGEAPRALRKVASGGELARVTLALKTVLAEVDRVPTLVFDEIDSGVGGRLGGVLGKTLAELARHHQVICVTHLPQMASYAGRQWVIQKRVSNGRTRATIKPLDQNGRVEELAVMLRGDAAAEGTRQEALSMLLEAQVSL